MILTVLGLFGILFVVSGAIVLIAAKWAPYGQEEEERGFRLTSQPRVIRTTGRQRKSSAESLPDVKIPVA